jgi:hypothetical protein
MKTELIDELKKKYPEFYKNLEFIEFEDGWFDLVSKCCWLIKQHINNKKYQNNSIDFHWTQQKSKFGGMRLYFDGGDDYIAGVIDMAESISYSTCQSCGEKGFLCRNLNWLEVFCEKCRIKNNYEIYKKD